MKQIIIYILFLLTATSCGLSEDSDIIQERDIELQFALEIPENQLVTAGLRSSYNENSVRCIDLLVFNENNQFIERVKVNNISGSGIIKTFSLRMKETSALRTFHIIANGRNENDADIINFSSVTTNMLESVAIPSLKTNTLVALTSPQLPLVMWGRISTPSITSNTTLGVVNMLRTAAAVSVECIPGNPNNGLSDFSLTGFTILKSSNMARVAPAAYTVPASTPSTVSLISGSGYIDYVNTSGTGVWSYGAGNAAPDLYLYERSNILNNTGLSVIIRGKYKGIDGYYKVWLKNNAGQVIHIVRNHRYLIQITKVFGAGYDSIEKATVADYSANIFTDIIDNDNDIVDMIADGKHELGISAPFTMRGSGSTTLGTVLNTNTSAIVTVTSDVAWLNNLVLTGSGNRKVLTGTFTSIGATSRTGTITVRAGSLTRTLTVTQMPN